MKNHLKRHPYLRFIDAPSAETGGYRRKRGALDGVSWV